MAALLVVAIDVGMTCTGVAYAVKDESLSMNDPHVIQKWPGNTANQSNKVPTVLCYKNNRLSSWGFLTNNEDDSDPNTEFREWFKVHLDPKEYRKAQAKAPESVSPSHEAVRLYYRDYLTKLNQYIQRQLEDNLGRTSWYDAEVEFIFSVPTTWTALGVTKDFEKLANEAGFGKGGPKHTLSVGLTEAEAAAVHTFKAQSTAYSDGDILLIVDAGGGTTDLALLKAHKKPGQTPKLEQLDEVRGDEIGSVEIDIAFEDLVTKRLQQAAQALNLSQNTIENAARQMAKTSFKQYKQDFGQEDSDRQETKFIPIPGISESTTLEWAGIRRGRMAVSNDEIGGLFDIQVKKMYWFIDHQMNRMAQIAPDSQITHMILSGGLGSSAYIKKELRQRYIRDSPNIYASNLTILTSQLPQLAVVKGIVQDRMQRLEQGENILVTRISRVSLGVVCRELYDPKKHQNRPVETDYTNGKRYAKGQIIWLVKQGMPLSTEFVEYPFHRTLLMNSPRLPWVSEIYISNNRAHNLPENVDQDGAKSLCHMKSNLTSVPLQNFKLKKKRPWQFWKTYQTHYKVCYDIRFQVKPAGVDFELWYAGKRYNDKAWFDVEWEEGALLSAPKDHLHSYDDDRRGH